MDSHRAELEPFRGPIHAAAAAAVRAALPARRPPPPAPPRLGAALNAGAAPSCGQTTRPMFHIGGGGIFFWWQAGVLQELRGLERFALRGASAGALAATLAACGVDAGAALDAAHALALRAGVFERPLGLVGVWGGMVRSWLEELLPEDAGARCSGRVEIVVTRWPALRRWAISEFASKREVVEACMASVHVPLLLDGRLAAEFRGHRVVDGALLDAAGEAARLALRPWGLPWLWERVVGGHRRSQGLWGEKEGAGGGDPAVVHLRCSHDAELARRGLGFFRVRGIDDVREMVELGAAHRKRLGAALEAA